MYTALSKDKRIKDIYIVGNFLSYGKRFVNLSNVNFQRDIVPIAESVAEAVGTQGASDFYHFFETTIPKIQTILGAESDWDVAASHAEANVRVLVAMNGQQLKKLAYDPSALVREHVAKQIQHKRSSLNCFELDYLLDKLACDSDAKVRAAVAACGKKNILDLLVGDASDYVRQAVARSGAQEHLDLLAKDSSVDVRGAVATTGSCTKLLCGDESELVRIVIANCSNPRDIDDTSLLADESENVRAVLASRGMYHEILATDSSKLVQEAVIEATNYAA